MKYGGLLLAAAAGAVMLISGCLTPPANPELAEEYARLAQAYQEMGEADKASTYYLKAHRLDPDLPIAAAGLVRARLEEGRYRRAVELAREAREEEPENQFLMEMEAYGLYLLEDYGEALSLYQSLLAEYPAHYRALYNSSLAAEKLDRPEQVVRSCETLAEAWPEKDGRILAHARALESLDREKDAAALLEKEQERGRLSGEGKLLLGRLYRRQELYARAVELYEELSGAAGKEDSLARQADFLRAELLLTVVGNTVEGLELLRQSLEAGYRGAEEAERLLDSLEEAAPASGGGYGEEDRADKVRGVFKEAGWSLNPPAPPEEG